MRVFLSIICPAILISVAFTDIEPASRAIGTEMKSIELTEQKSQASALTKKKKRLKKSNKTKKHNRSMGKGFRRKNDDTLRRD